METDKHLKWFRTIAILEGISYLLLAVTMPIKYLGEIPEPNLVVGMAHGILFLTYCAFGLFLAIKMKWSIAFSAVVFFASLIPFGTFILENRYLKKGQFSL